MNFQFRILVIGNLTKATEQNPALRYINVDDFDKKNSEKFDAIVIVTNDDSSFLSTVRRIRSDAMHYLTPIFCTKRKQVKYCDGIYNANKINSQLPELIEKIEDLKNKNHIMERTQNSWRLRLVTYLFSRFETKKLEASDTDQKASIKYPIIDTFISAESKYHNILKDFENSGFLSKECLVESFDNISTHKTDFYNYTLTDNAKSYIHLNTGYNLEVFDDINYIKPDSFYNMLEWNCKMQSRDPAFEASLIKITISNDIETSEIDKLATSVKELLRSTDLLTKISNKHIWLMLPNTCIDGGKIVLDKLSNIEVSTKENVKHGLFFSNKKFRTKI